MKSINFNDLKLYQKPLSEDFIREFKNKVDWNWISVKQKLSENFIREFKDKVSWGYIKPKYNIKRLLNRYPELLEFII